MSALKRLFKQTFIYGLATVLPRVLGILLTPLYIYKLPEADYGIYTSLMVLLILGNVMLSYGMETAFFRFINKSERKALVQSTALTSITVTSIVFLIVALMLRNHLADWFDYQVPFVMYGAVILFLDALAVIPFAWFRKEERPIRYSFVKIFSVVVNLVFNLFFFLLLPVILEPDNETWGWLHFDNQVHYIFIANIIASFTTLLWILPLYHRIGFSFDSYLWRKMITYAYPVLLAGIAFAINEGFDKLILRYLLPAEIADQEVGVYGGVYKLGVFMTLFVTAFKLGVEPFFFSQANKKDAPKTYADITQYFVIFACVIFLGVVVYTDLIKLVLLPDSNFWRALWVVPFILMANLCLGVYHNLSVWYKITDKTIYGAYISLTGAVITLALNFILIPYISYKGSAIATLAAYGSMMVISYLMGQKKYPIPYDVKKILTYMSLAGGFGCLSFYVFDRNMVIGTAFLFLFLAIIYQKERKDLKRYIKPKK
ncbi:oligosaccharide flippase family protein [Robertkochia aurantiaca]|uniref:oligosaccharide flippase family protein n=1 Tax=Robertkochia aurantiaca TaxID=2873700 RepID=UPI001CCBF630|nr:polysaccharide biosynthesis C-terminal domain-containing protein [Robertkochia sp. 3YJGBD-33]